MWRCTGSGAVSSLWPTYIFFSLLYASFLPNLFLVILPSTLDCPQMREPQWLTAVVKTLPVTMEWSGWATCREFGWDHHLRVFPHTLFRIPRVCSLKLFTIKRCRPFTRAWGRRGIRRVFPICCLAVHKHFLQFLSFPAFSLLIPTFLCLWGWEKWSLRAWVKTVRKCEIATRSPSWTTPGVCEIIYTRQPGTLDHQYCVMI